MSVKGQIAGPTIPNFARVQIGGQVVRVAVKDLDTEARDELAAKFRAGLDKVAERQEREEKSEAGAQSETAGA